MKFTPRSTRSAKLVAAALAGGALSACSTLQLPSLAQVTWPPEQRAQAAQSEVPAAEQTVTMTADGAAQARAPRPDRLYRWQGDERQISRVIIDLDRQEARFFHGEELIGWSTVATGVADFPTPTGQFEVIEKVSDKRSNLYGKIYNSAGEVIDWDARAGREAVPTGGRFAGAKMPYFLRLTYDGVGLHAGSIPNPGEPASHGCIRLPKDVAPVLFRNVSYGTPVTIVGTGPSYGNYAARVREMKRARSAKAEASPARSVENASAAATPSRPPADSASAAAAAATPAATGTTAPAPMSGQQPHSLSTETVGQANSSERYGP